MAADAHHSHAIFNTRAQSELTGDVVKLGWTNPHAYITLDVVDDEGRRVEHYIEMQTQALMTQLGWTRDSLTPGETITVLVNPARRAGDPRALGHLVTRANGEKLYIYQPGSEGLAQELREQYQPTPEVTPAEGIEARWKSPGGENQGLGFLFFNAGQAWPVTEAGRAALEESGYSNEAAYDCVLEAVPMLHIFGLMHRFEISADRERIDFIVEGYDRRTIDMTAESHDGAEPSHHGHSIGRWDGDALVVETEAFDPHPNGLAAGLPSSAGKRLTERFELSDDRTELLYAFTLEDPVYLREPFSGSFTFSHTPDVPIAEHQNCDLEASRRSLPR